MSKAVNNDFPFDLEKYTMLLNQAKGNRTQEKFASDCGLTVAYVCKSLNGRFDKSPIPSTIRRIAACAENGVTETDLLMAAGYIPDKYLSATEEHNDQSELEALNAINIIKSSLSNLKFKWIPLLETNLPEYASFGIECGDIFKCHWTFEYITDIDNSMSDENFKKVMNEKYGSLSASNIFSKGYIKHSFITNDKILGEKILDYAPVHLDFYISLIFVSIQAQKIIGEKLLASPSTPLQEIPMLG